MPKYNADEVSFEPIEVTLNGKVYTVTEVTQDMFDRVKKNAEENSGDLKIIAEQLGIVFNVEPSEFSGMDLRKLNGVVRFVTNAITDQVQGKNA